MEIADLRIVSFKQILKEQSQQLPSHLQSLVAVVIFVVDVNIVAVGQDDSTNHQCHVDRFHFEIPLHHL